MGEVRTISRKPSGLLRRKAGEAAKDPQRLYAGEPCSKQFTVQGWKVLV